MKTITIHLFLLALMGSHSLLADAQTLSADLEKVKKQFDSQQPFNATVEVKYYTKESDKTPSLYKKGLVKKWGAENYYSSFDNKEYLVNKKYTVLVDKNNKTIIVNTTSPKQVNGSNELSIPEMSKKMEEKFSTKRIVAGELVTYYVTDKKAEALSYSITLEKNGTRLSKIVYYGGLTYQKTEITYKYPSDDIVFTKDDFSEARYVRKENNLFKPTSAFSDYQISDQTK